MAISANTLFHFTRDFETLLKILRTQFYPRLCLERRLWAPGNTNVAVPMVCFCDIPLSKISQHTKKYGNYAIGIKKTWAIKHGVTPILYVHENSGFIGQGLSALNWCLELAEKDTSRLNERLAEVMSMFFMMKPYEGSQIVNGEIEKIRFYDEREWRYIPPIDEGRLNCLTEEEFHDEVLRNERNQINEKYGVPFNPDVINYLIVEKEDEIVPLIHEILSIKGSFPYNSVELMTSRILSMDRIKEDF